MSDSLLITLNETATLVALVYSGHITAERMRFHVAEIGKLAERLKPGFIVLSDLTALESMDPDCAPLLSQAMEQFNRYGVGRIIRVIPDPKKDIGLGILSLFHYKRGVPTQTVATLAEAHRLL